jgi:hypothetical protein
MKLNFDSPAAYLRFIYALSFLVPIESRLDWRREWEAEIIHRWQVLQKWNRLNMKSRLDLSAKVAGATRDAVTFKNNKNFPVTPGAFQTGLATPFEFDAFVTKMNSTGTALIYSTYFGGANRDRGNDIAIDAAGNAYITGLTDSGDLPHYARRIQDHAGRHRRIRRICNEAQRDGHGPHLLNVPRPGHRYRDYRRLVWKRLYHGAS